MKKNKLLAFLSGLLAIGAVVYLSVSGFDDTVVYYKTVNEIMENPAGFADRPVRVNGILVEGSVKAKTGSNEYRFKLIKQNSIMEVSYKGILPDTMREGFELLVQGVFNTNSNLFVANEILTKCPSKYESKN